MGEAAYALDAAERLVTSVSSEERVHLIDHHIAEVSEDMGDGRVSMQEHGLQGLRRDLEDA